MANERLLVIGGDAAGMSAASQAQRAAGKRRRGLDIVVVEQSHVTSYSACGLPYLVAGEVTGGREALVTRNPEEHRERGIDVRLGTTAHGIDIDAQTVEVTCESGAQTLEYDHLMIATGSRPFVPDFAAGLPRVQALKTLADGQRWLDLLDDGAQRITIIGGGYIGVELAEALRTRGRDVSMCISGGTVLENVVDPELGERITEHLESLGVNVFKERAVGIEHHQDPSNLTMCVTLDGGGSIESDAVALCVGARPNTEFITDERLAKGASGALLPNNRQQLTENIWTAGDCAEVYHRVLDKPAYLPLATHATKAGRVAGINITGGDATFDGALGTSICRVGDLEVASTGVGYRNFVSAGIKEHDIISTTLESGTAVGYFDAAQPMTVKVTARRSDGVLIGTQILGGEGAGKRIDAAVMAVWNRMTVTDAAYADFAYAPPFSTTWDPFQIACRKIAEELN